ncbi:hypothetical protein [Micromonospora purpureochromogenes]|uniref:Uncharacterized protein n=1 Tax=Micromonospora purpureochromogenes TaxID=47872 RepID=A0ABX2RQK7_9ACTN|nr:hypothetical protein [Micromonospora purpureochromogenes]NYF58815.1 hypothetical protein [Micromonospora purpureochromogenes]
MVPDAGSLTARPLLSLSAVGLVAVAAHAPDQPATLDDLIASPWMARRASLDGDGALATAVGELRDAKVRPEGWRVQGTVPVPRWAVLETSMTLRALGMLIFISSERENLDVIEAVLDPERQHSGNADAQKALHQLRESERVNGAPIGSAVRQLFDAGIPPRLRKYV